MSFQKKKDSFNSTEEVIDLAAGEMDKTEKVGLLGRLSRATARNPRKALTGSLVISIVLSVIGVQLGGFKIEVDNKGWRSRGTLIADREMQAEVMNLNRAALFADEDGSEWNRLKTTVTEGYVDFLDRDDVYTRRRLLGANERIARRESGFDKYNPFYGARESFQNMMNRREARVADGSKTINSNPFRKMELSDTCDATWYDDYSNVLLEDNTFAVWKIQADLEDATLSALDKEVLVEICKAEVNTLEIMKEAGVCKTCGDGSCLPALSLVLLVRNKLNDHDSSCDDLMTAYTSEVQSELTSELLACTTEYNEAFDSNSLAPGDTPSCPSGFQPGLVDIFFTSTGKIRFTSSYFNTYEADVNDVYDVYLDFDIAENTDVVEGTYDTVYENFNIIYVDELVISDMALAVASLSITFTAMLIHTRSPWLTLFGVLQVILAIPLAYFVYVFIAGLTFFPFLNFIGVFVSAALGADDLFVAVDKFKNARIHNQAGSTEDIAQVAFPDAAGAMLLTTSTTMVAFFATCICPVPPILCFAVYCGLMIVFNYVMNVVLVFPALCLYDIWLQNGSKNFLVAMCSSNLTKEDDIEDLEKEDPDNEKPMHLSLIHRILNGYYHLLHRFRWFVLAASIAATVVAAIYAFSLKQPESTEVRLLPEGHPLEDHFMWQSLLLTANLFTRGTSVQLIFGLKAGDTGTQNNPDTLSKLRLDDTFTPSTTEFQTYLKGFCERVFEDEFTNPAYTGYECPMNLFDTWLQEQSAAPGDVYTENCNGATSLPMAEEDFDKCIITWSKATSNNSILQENGTVRIIVVDAQAEVSFRSSIADLDNEWNNYEKVLDEEKKLITGDWNGYIHVSPMWWWKDTNAQMFNTAIGAAGIAIAFSAVVVLLASRSLILTLFSGICILYVLAAATATLVGLGWELGFLESVCFAILVGISCDFVIHFSHAYIHFKGHVDRTERSKYAILHMGPSILAAALTTFASAIVMLFCKVIFFTKFAMILLMTILHATVGSFVVFIVLSDLFGPAEPTKMFDRLLGKKEKDQSEEGRAERVLETPASETEKDSADAEVKPVNLATTSNGDVEIDLGLCCGASNNNTQ